MSPVHYNTTDLYEAAYLMLRGCRIEGISKLSPYSSSIVFSCHGILDLVEQYKTYARMPDFSPRSYGEKREELKRLIKCQPQP